MARIIDSDFLHRALQHFYGYSSFRTGQEEIISEILHGQPVLAVLPTGAGKSICFQLPSLLLKGVTLVISPLISLMKDQAEALTARGIPAAYLDSSMSSNTQEFFDLMFSPHKYSIFLCRTQCTQKISHSA